MSHLKVNMNNFFPLFFLFSIAWGVLKCTAVKANTGSFLSPSTHNKLMGRMIPKGERNLSTRRKICPSNSSTTNPIWTGPRGGKLATDTLNHGTALSYSGFRVTTFYRLIQCRRNTLLPLSALKMETSSYFSAVVPTFQTSERFIPVTTSISCFVCAQ